MLRHDVGLTGGSSRGSPEQTLAASEWPRLSQQVSIFYLGWTARWSHWRHNLLQQRLRPYPSLKI